MDFIPDTAPTDKRNRMGYSALKLAQAFLEDGLAGYTTGRTESAISADVINLLSHAGAEKITLKPGQNPHHKRPAFLLEFVWGGLNIRIIQVALPVRTKTERSIQQSRRQALYNLHESIRMELERRHYQPSLVPFAGYVLAPGQEKTLAELLAADEVPMLSAPMVGEIIG